MKSLFLALSMFIASTASAQDVLKNCYAKSSKAQFFASDLGDIAKNGETPLLLLNDAQQVVGVVSVTLENKVVRVHKLSLCAQLEVSDFHYADDEAGNLLEWVKAGEVAITQDEGMIVLNAKVAKKEAYATLLKVDFKAYDVMTEETEQFKGQPDYLKDWGLPKGKGSFYIYIPHNWLK